MDPLLDRPFRNRLGIRAPDTRPIRDILLEVCERRYISLPELLSRRRHAAIVSARQEAMWECRRQTSASFPQIAKALGYADHTTVIHGIRQHEERMRLNGAA